MFRFEEISTNNIVFNKRPDSIPHNYRISYRVAIIALIISICSPRKGCSLVKLHIINDALNNNNLIDEIKDIVDHKVNDVVINFDSSLNRALGYAIADGLIFQQNNKTFKLTKTGLNFVIELKGDESLLSNEKERLNEINNNLDDITLNKIVERWSVSNDTY